MAAYHISRYAKLISDADKLDIFDAENCIKITLTNIFPEYNNKWIPEHHLSLMVDVTRSLMVNELNPLAIHFQHSDPGYADAMKMDTSTIYRQLRKEGATFEKLLIDTRQELAKNYLLQGMSNAQVAYLIGFSEPAAFQRWIGINPGEYRRSFSI